MADRVRMTSPAGRGVARVPVGRVEAYKANGWREVATPKPVPRRRKPAKPDSDDK